MARTKQEEVGYETFDLVVMNYCRFVCIGVRALHDVGIYESVRVKRRG